MKRNFILLFILALTSIFLLSAKATAANRQNITDWYLKDFKSEIVVNKDSSLDITEKITADCGNLPDKHGIFRTLPTQVYKTVNQTIKTPIDLVSITDFDDKPIKYSTTLDRSNKTVTWKIGDPDVTVSGLNYFKIKYRVQNAIRFDNQNFDEFYWNLNGNFWDIETDNFEATIIFPEGFNNEDSELNIYSGGFKEKDAGLAETSWSDKKTLVVNSTRMLESGEGITASVTSTKGLFTPYVPTFWEKNSIYFYSLIPVLVLMICYSLWRRFGKDPSINPVVVPEFEIPEKLSPLEMGVIRTDGILKNNFISASIINLAVNGVLKIEKIEKKGMFGSSDYKLSLTSKNLDKISKIEKKLLDDLFDGSNEILISDLKNKFYKNIPDLRKEIMDSLSAKKLLVKSSRVWQAVFVGIAVLFVYLAISSFAIDSVLGVGLFVSVLVWLVFSFFMTRRTLEGAKLNQRILGFKLYMETAEKYRQQFNEKENIFEKFLPYAIMFGMTKEWIKKMKDIYGEAYFNSYHPVWFYGTGFSNFNVDNITSEISSLSSGMASTISSSPSGSGSGGGGFSGGGGGGGGGGGW